MTGYLVMGAALLVALAVVAVDRWRTARTIRRLDDMLTAVINGNFSEETFDESRLSALESRLGRYLAASALSERNVREQKDQISALISDISHQTKTPVANILLYASLLAEEDLPPEQAAQAATLRQQAEKLAFLIEGLVKASRLETGILTTAPEAGPVGALLEDAARQAAPAAEKKGIRLEVVPFSGQARFDKKWTGEALFNVVDNAVKYTPTGGTVTLSATAYELFCRIDVADTGPGIPEEEQAAIFGRFRRGKAARDQEGVGIGLYLAREILRRQGGYIKVSSQPGEGSVFSLYLPRA